MPIHSFLFLLRDLKPKSEAPHYFGVDAKIGNCEILIKLI